MSDFRFESGDLITPRRSGSWHGPPYINGHVSFSYGDNFITLKHGDLALILEVTQTVVARGGFWAYDVVCAYDNKIIHRTMTSHNWNDEFEVVCRPRVDHA